MNEHIFMLGVPWEKGASELPETIVQNFDIQ